MLIFETRCKVKKVGVNSVEYNGYGYKVVLVDIGNIQDFHAFIPVKRNVEVGDCLNISNCSLTNYKMEDGTETLAIRVEAFTKVDEQEFEPVEEFRVKVNGSVMRTERSQVKYIGPVKKPLLKATLRVFNENRKMFNILLVGYCKSVKILEEIENGRYIDCEAVLKTQSKNKKHKYAYQLNIENFKYIQKGE